MKTMERMSKEGQVQEVVMKFTDGLTYKVGAPVGAAALTLVGTIVAFKVGGSSDEQPLRALGGVVQRGC